MYTNMHVWLCFCVDVWIQERKREGRERKRERGGGIEQGAVIIYRSRYHRLLVNRPHQGVGEKRDGEAQVEVDTSTHIVVAVVSYPRIAAPPDKFPPLTMLIGYPCRISHGECERLCLGGCSKISACYSLRLTDREWKSRPILRHQIFNCMQQLSISSILNQQSLSVDDKTNKIISILI